MLIKLIAENKDDEKIIKAKEIGFKGVTDFAFIVRWKENNLVEKWEHKFSGNITFLMEKAFTMLQYLKETYRRKEVE